MDTPGSLENRLGFTASQSCWCPSVAPAEIARLRRKVRRAPGDPYAHWDLGKSLADGGRDKEGIKHLRQACRLSPRQPDFHLSLGEAVEGIKHRNKLSEAEYRTALRLYRQALRRSPADGTLNFKIGKAFDSLRETKKAIAAYRQAIQLRPDFGEVHYELSLLLDGKEKLVELREAVRLNPNSAEYQLGLASSLALQDDRAGAVAGYRAAIRLDPANAQTHVDLGEELDALGDIEGAEEEFRKAERLDSRVAALGRFNRGGMMLWDEDTGGAIAQLQKALALSRHDGLALDEWNSLGVAYHRKGDLSRAITAYRKALRVKSSDTYYHAYPHNNLGVALEQTRDFKGALHEFRMALRSDKCKHMVRNNMGRTLEKKGDLRRALMEYGKAIQLAPKCEICRTDYARVNLTLATERRAAPDRRRSARKK